MDKPKVGIGVIIENNEGKILVGKRKGGHAPYYSIPGGNLEPGETFENAAVREIKEETNLVIKNPQVIAVTNNLKTFEKEGVHYISVILYTNFYSGTLSVMEKDKCEGFEWVKPTELPHPHFDASELGVKCFLENKFYSG